jgi:type I restriction enzyme S subunit
MLNTRKRKLGSLVNHVDYGLTASATSHYMIHKFLRITDIKDGIIDWDDVPFCEVEEDVAKKYHLEEGDIVFARTGSVGNTCLIFEPPLNAVFASYLIRIRPKQEVVDPTYLSYFFKSEDYWRQVQKLAVGTTHRGLNATKLKVLEIPLPPIPEQKRIAAILEKADRLRRLRRYARKLSDTFLQSVFLEMFGDPVENSMGFPTSKIGEITQKVSKINPKDHPKKEIQYIDITSIDSRYGEIKGWKSIVGKYAPSRARQVLKNGDVLISTVRPNLRATALVGAGFNEFVCSTGFCVLRPSDRLISEFLFGITRQSSFSDWLTRIAKGASYPAVTDWDIKQISIPIPQKQLQANYAEALERFSRLRIHQLESERQMEHLFQSLLHRAFRGEL